MAGIFGDEINNRREFFEQLELALDRCRQLIAAYPEEDTLVSVQMQLEAIRTWTTHGRTPMLSERESLDMSLRMFREYEMTDDVSIFEFRDLISGLHSYVEQWPDDDVAADPRNPDYL
jgi:2-C-methyl-D-erythritol 4-phosphate cytidylyltransferase